MCCFMQRRCISKFLLLRTLRGITSMGTGMCLLALCGVCLALVRMQCKSSLNAILRLHESKEVLSDETSDVLSKSRSVVPPMTKDADLR